MIIIAGAIILSLSNGNVISKAKEAKAKSNLAALQEQWNNAYAYASALVNSTTGLSPTKAEIDTQIGSLQAEYVATTTGLVYTRNR